MNRREFLRGAAAVVLSSGAVRGCRGDAGPPHVLLLTIDDLGDLPACTGGPVPGVTPHIDRLAAEGICFARGHVNISVCRPSRAVLMTGRYPHRNGTAGGGPVRSDVPVLTDSLRAAGYRLGILGKVDHLQPVQRYGWDDAQIGRALGGGRDPALYGRFGLEFLRRCDEEGLPGFLMANTHDSHRPFAGSLEEKRVFDEASIPIVPPSRVFAPDEVEVPGYLPDLPSIRREVAQYYGSARRADDSVGALLTALRELGLEDRTLVLLLSDNGPSFPFAKTNCYWRSTRVPWIVRWPGRIAAGAVDGVHFVSGVDVMPTLLDVLGLPEPAGLDGRSFWPLLTGESQAGRDRLVTVVHHDLGGMPLEMRCIHDERYGYLFNAWSDGRRRFANEAQRGLTLDAMRRAAPGDPEIARRLKLFFYRVPEELYDFAADPDARRDLSREPGSRPVLERLRAELLAWMQARGDPLEAGFHAHLAGLEARAAS